MKPKTYVRLIRWVSQRRYVATLRQGVHYSDERTLRRELKRHAESTCRYLFFERVPEHKRVRVLIY